MCWSWVTTTRSSICAWATSTRSKGSAWWRSSAAARHTCSADMGKSAMPSARVRDRTYSSGGSGRESRPAACLMASSQTEATDSRNVCPGSASKGRVWGPIRPGSITSRATRGCRGAASSPGVLVELQQGGLEIRSDGSSTRIPAETNSSRSRLGEDARNHDAVTRNQNDLTVLNAAHDPGKLRLGLVNIVRIHGPIVDQPT
jgi:hypothetical protein